MARDRKKRKLFGQREDESILGLTQVNEGCIEDEFQETCQVFHHVLKKRGRFNFFD